jgi:hypothetical protein
MRQVNRSLTHLSLSQNSIRGDAGGENVVALVSRCTNLDSLDYFHYGPYHVANTPLSPEQHRRLDLLFDRKRLHTEAQALGSAPFSVVFQKLLQVNTHEQGLSASFVILSRHIFAEKQHKSSSGEQKIQAAGVKRKR